MWGVWLACLLGTGREQAGRSEITILPSVEAARSLYLYTVAMTGLPVLVQWTQSHLHGAHSLVSGSHLGWLSPTVGKDLFLCPMWRHWKELESLLLTLGFDKVDSPIKSWYSYKAVFTLRELCMLSHSVTFSQRFYHCQPQLLVWLDLTFYANQYWSFGNYSRERNYVLLQSSRGGARWGFCFTLVALVVSLRTWNYCSFFKEITL